MKLAPDQKKTPLALMRGTVEDETRAGPEENSPRAHVHDGVTGRDADGL